MPRRRRYRPRARRRTPAQGITATVAATTPDSAICVTWASCGRPREAMQIVRCRLGPVGSNGDAGQFFVGGAVGGYHFPLSGSGGGGDDQVVGSSGTPLPAYRDQQLGVGCRDGRVVFDDRNRDLTSSTNCWRSTRWGVSASSTPTSSSATVIAAMATSSSSRSGRRGTPSSDRRRPGRLCPVGGGSTASLNLQEFPH